MDERRSSNGRQHVNRWEWAALTIWGTALAAIIVVTTATALAR